MKKPNKTDSYISRLEALPKTSAVPWTSNQKANLKDDIAVEKALAPVHELDMEPDGLSPTHRQGRRIASRQDRPTGVLIKFSVDEHESLRRVSSHLGYSLSHTIRMLIAEKELALWPDPADRPNVLALHMEDKKRKQDAIDRTKAHIQRWRNALQKKEMKLVQKADWTKARIALLESREKETIAELEKMKAARAIKRESQKAMDRREKEERKAQKELHKRTVEAVHNAIRDEQKRLGRKLTEKEKWGVGMRVRGGGGRNRKGG